MKNLYKYVNEDTTPIRATNPLFLDDYTVIANPNEKTLRKNGYTDLVEVSPMEFKDGLIAKPHYELRDNVIYVTYTYEEDLNNEFIRI